MKKIVLFLKVICFGIKKSVMFYFQDCENEVNAKSLREILKDKVKLDFGKIASFVAILGFGITLASIVPLIVRLKYYNVPIMFGNVDTTSFIISLFKNTLVMLLIVLPIAAIALPKLKSKDKLLLFTFNAYLGIITVLLITITGIDMLFIIYQSFPILGEMIGSFLYFVTKNIALYFWMMYILYLFFLLHCYQGSYFKEKKDSLILKILSYIAVMVLLFSIFCIFIKIINILTLQPNKEVIIFKKSDDSKDEYASITIKDGHYVSYLVRETMEKDVYECKSDKIELIDLDNTLIIKTAKLEMKRK